MTVALLIRQPEKNAVLFPDNWIYIHDNQVQMGRIQNFNNWSLEMVPQPEEGTLTCLGLEYFCNQGDTLWEKPDEELLALAKKELMQVGISPSGTLRMPGLRVEDGCVVRMPKAYPVYGMKYRDTLRVIRKELENFSNLQVCGRNGMHKYNNQDHSMMTGLLAARNIANRARASEKNLFDLWSVNEDSLYQEEA